MKQVMILLFFAFITVEAAFTKHYKGITLSVEDGNLLAQNVDAIVNSANEACLTGQGIDGVITNAGGASLRDARSALKFRQRFDGKFKKCPTGDARLTISGDIQTKYKVPYVLHAVGPKCLDKVEMCPGVKPSFFNLRCDNALRDAFLNSLKTADDFNTYLRTGKDQGHTEFAAVKEVHKKPITSIAFPAISGSSFKCQNFVAKSAIQAIQKFVQTRNDNTITQIKFVVHDPVIRAQLALEIQQL